MPLELVTNLQRTLQEQPRSATAKRTEQLVMALSAVFVFALPGGAFGHSRHRFADWPPAGTVAVFLLVCLFPGTALERLLLRGAMGLRDHFVDVDGVRLHWTEAGEASDRPPVVFLHALNNSCLSWARVATLFANDRRVLMPDLPGHGQSERADASYELDWYARIITRWLDKVGIEQADVVGHSFGGGIAQLLLLECPKRVRRLVLVAPGGLGKDVGLWLRLASLPGLVESLGQPFMALGTRLALREAREGVTRKDVVELSRFNAQAGSARAFARSVRDVVNWRGQRRNFFHRVNEVEELPAILLLWGDRDALIPIEQGRAFADQLAGTVFKIFQSSGHFLHNEQPEAFAKVVREFFDDPAVLEARLKRSITAPHEAARRTEAGRNAS